MKRSAKIKSAIQEPQKAFLKLRTIYNRQIRKRKGLKIMEEDWDNLIILDACRFDLFKKFNRVEGELSQVTSRGSNTYEFLENNFTQDHFDTIYISANPQTQNFGVGNYVHKHIPLWETSWNEDLQTVLPSSVVEKAIKFSSSYPKKKMIIHFLQPHYPFIGGTGKKISHTTVTGDGVISDGGNNINIWNKTKQGKVEIETVREAYEENTKIVMPHVESLTESIDGKTVITSDHGNALGEWNVYGHPRGKYMKCLTSVPWLVTISGERKDIEFEINRQKNDSENEVVQERLKRLGYVEE